MLRNLLRFNFFVMLFVGCTVSQLLTTRITSQTDEFEGTHYLDLTYNWVPRTIAQGSLAFDVRRFISPAGDTSFFLVLRYIADDWLFIEEGESLVLLIDGQRFGFTGDGSMQHRDVLSGSVSEQAFYRTDLKTLEQISTSKSVRFKISGAQYYTEGAFNETNIKNIRDFLNQAR